MAYLEQICAIDIYCIFGDLYIYCIFWYLFPIKVWATKYTREKSLDTHKTAQG